MIVNILLRPAKKSLPRPPNFARVSYIHLVYSLVDNNGVGEGGGYREVYDNTRTARTLFPGAWKVTRFGQVDQTDHPQRDHLDLSRPLR